MKKPLIGRLLAILALLALIASACGSDDSNVAADDAAGTDDAAVEDDASADETMAEDMGDAVTLSFGFGFPEGHSIYQQVLIPWAEEVSEATDGTVTIEFFPGGALGPPPTEYERVSTGVNDLGWSLPAYTAGQFPLVQAVEMPFLFSSATEGTDALLTLWEEFPELGQEFDDTKLLGLFVHDTGALWSSSGVKTTLADVEGMSLRSAGASVNRLIEQINGDAVNMPVTELFDAMDRGTVDGTVIAASALLDFNLTELLDSGILCDCYVLSFFVSMNLDTWDGLSAAQQAAIESVSGRETWMKTGPVFDEVNAAALAGAAEAGVELYTPEGAELEAWLEASERAVDAWINEDGGDPAVRQAMYDRLLEITG